jgi:hypothetical protein
MAIFNRNGTAGPKRGRALDFTPPPTYIFAVADPENASQACLESAAKPFREFHRFEAWLRKQSPGRIYANVAGQWYMTGDENMPFEWDGARITCRHPRYGSVDQGEDAVQGIMLYECWQKIVEWTDGLAGIRTELKRKTRELPEDPP